MNYDHLTAAQRPSFFNGKKTVGKRLRDRETRAQTVLPAAKKRLGVESAWMKDGVMSYAAR
jgi:hypothetical protein